MARNGQPRGLLPRFNPEVLADAFATAERLEHQLDRLAAQMERQDREELRGEAFSRVATGSQAGGTQDVGVTPNPGALWEVAVICPYVSPAAANRTFALYLGGVGDTSRPLRQSATAQAGPDGIGGLQVAALLPTSQGVWARFFALVAGETPGLHIAGREFAAVGADL